VAAADCPFSCCCCCVHLLSAPMRLARLCVCVSSTVLMYVSSNRAAVDVLLLTVCRFRHKLTLGVQFAVCGLALVSYRLTNETS
jgi:hypothetical protein